MRPEILPLCFLFCDKTQKVTVIAQMVEVRIMFKPRITWEPIIRRYLEVA